MGSSRPQHDTSLAEFGHSIITKLAVPVLSQGYSDLVQRLKANRELAKIVVEQGIDAVLSGDSEAMASLRKNNRELVTTAEQEAEFLMTAAVKKRFPGHAIIGEELGFTPGGHIRWVFDPVDGTSAMIKTAMAEAYSIRLGSPAPTFGVTLAVIEGSQLILGIVAELEARDGSLSAVNIWIGEKDTPPQYNNKPIKLPQVPQKLKDANVACTVPQIMFGTKEKWSSWQALAEGTQSVITGQNCVGYMKLMQEGSNIHIVYEADLAYHDAAALVPILESAGLTVSDGQGLPLKFPEAARTREFSILAAAAPLHKQALDTILKGVAPDKNSFAKRVLADNGYANKFPALEKKP